MPERPALRPRMVPAPDERHEPFPMTDMQQAFYVGRIHGGGAGAQVHLEFEVDRLDPAALERAWNRLVAETDMLRAVVQADGRLRVRREVEMYRVSMVDLTGASSEERGAAVDRIRVELRAITFDPHRWPPFAIRVALLPGDRARVFFAVDEMMVDGPSLSLLVRAWHRAYRGLPSSAPQAVFRDYALATIRPDDDPAVRAALRYWREKLAGVDLARPSPLARPDAAGGAGGRRRLLLRLPQPLWRRVKRHARDRHATPSALLLGLFTAALRRQVPVTGPLPVVLTTYNRQPLHPDVPRMIGPFTSTAIFLAPPADGDLDELLGAVRRQLWADLEHSVVGGVRVLRDRARDDPGQRNAAVPVVFTSMLGSIASADPDERDSWAARVDTTASVTTTPGVLLEVIAQEQDGELRLFFDFPPAEVDVAAVERVFAAIRRALDELAGGAAGQPASLGTVDRPDTPLPVRLPLTEIQSAYLVGRLAGGDETRVYQEFRLRRHDADRLEAAWRRLVDHHPMLRAAVHADGTLSIAPTVDFPVLRNDLLGRGDVDRALDEVRRRMLAEPLPLARAPMFRLELSHLPDGTLVLHAVLDALVADARSLALLFDQLFRLHDGDESVLAAPADSYPEYLRGRVRHAAGPDAERARARWRDRFARLPAGPPLAGTEGGPRVHRRFDLDGWCRLRDRAQRVGVPADVLLLTAYCDVLGEEYGPEPFTVVVVSWDRPADLDHADALVGDFTRLAWLVVDEHLPAGFADRAREIWRRLREDLDRAEVVDGLGPLRQQVARSRGALRLPVVFTRLPVTDPAPPPPGVEVRFSQSQTAQVALDHVSMLLGDRLVCQWDAVADALPADRLDALFARYRDRIHRLADPPVPAEPPVAVDASGSADPSPRGAASAPPPDGGSEPGWTLPSLLQAALAEHADREAVRYDGSGLTYRELAARSARLARYLRRIGCRPGDLVGVHMDRSADLVVTLLAVVRAGAAYVPIDPVNPPDRVRFLLEDSGVRVVVADAHRRKPLADLGIRVVCPDRDADAIGAEEAGPLEAGVGPSDPVYMIYTSGTTGWPKGCPNSQRGVTNRLLWMQNRFRLAPGDRVAQKTPYGFDVSVWEFFWPLLTGATIVVARPDGHVDPGYLASLFRAEQVTVTHFVPSMLGMFLRQPGAADCRDLRYVFASGEALPTATADRFFEVLPGAELHNLYGPTEAAIDVTHWACRPGWAGPIPIGRPIANTDVYLLDEQRRPVGPGEVGEIYLGGYGVALGYHRRPELEAERFVPSPFPGSRSERLYRTGDLGRFGPDGELYFLGRTDNQFKIRGLRVEAEEIETALTAVPGVSEARVLPVPDPAGGQALAALCVAAGDAPPTARVRAALARTLPAYLVPSRVRFVGRLPVTGNGKLDRAAALRMLKDRTEHPAGPGQPTGPEQPLGPEPVAAEPAPRSAAPPAAAPVTAADIAAYASELLGGTPVGADDDLFEAGATSFTMIRLAQLVLERHGVTIPVEVLIESATPGGIAAGLSVPAPAAPAPTAPAPTVPAGADLRIALDPEAKAEFKRRRVSRRVLGGERARIPLGRPDPAELVATSSVREFADEPVELAALTRLLDVFGEDEVEGRSTRLYPSAGGFYPVQVYLYARPGRVRGLEEGGIHYLDPVGRCLVVISPGAIVGSETQVRYNRTIVDGASFALFLVSTPAAITPAYGNRLADRYTLVEAGHLAQLAIERATPLGLGLCVVGEMEFDQVRPHFDLDDGQELVVSLWGGTLPAAHRERYRRLRAGPGAVPGGEPGGPRPGSPARATDRSLDTGHEPVAVVGFAAELPGTGGHDCLDDLANLLESGGTAIGPMPADRWPDGPPRVRHAGAQVGAYLADVAGFEAAEFGVDAREAAAIDPQERLLLQVVRACLDDAAIIPERLARCGPVGVFTGAMWQDHSLYGPAGRDTHANRSGLAHRLSHAFDLTGPSLVLDAGCVSGLAAIDAACRAIRSGECVAAVAAAANLVLHPYHLEFLARVGLLAEEADSSAFTERASGWIVGEGVAAVLLKPLRAALADRDPIHAVLRGSAVRHAGTTRDYGLPNAGRQVEVMRAALADAGLPAAAVGYVEAAASGAALADALELRGLDTLLAERPGPVPVGSVKPTLGHMEAASVFAQLAKVIAQFRRGRILPTRMTGPANPMLPNRRVRVVTDATAWPGPGRVALVDSFAGTGVYGCLVVEEPPLVAADAGPAPGPVALPLSADSPDLLAVAAKRLAARLERHPSTPLAEVEAALWHGRRHRSCRGAVVAGPGEVVAALRELADQVRALGAGRVVARGAVPVSLATWLAGGAPDGALPSGRRAHLPPTPVRRDRYWFGPSAPTTEAVPVEGPESAGRPTPAAAGQPAPDDVLRVVLDAVQATGVAPTRLTADADPIALGIDSRQLLRMARRIEAASGLRVPLELLYEAGSLGELAALLAASNSRPGPAAPPADGPGRPEVDRQFATLRNGARPASSSH